MTFGKTDVDEKNYQVFRTTGNGDGTAWRSDFNRNIDSLTKALGYVGATKKEKVAIIKWAKSEKFGGYNQD